VEVLTIAGLFNDACAMRKYARFGSSLHVVTDEMSMVPLRTLWDLDKSLPWAKVFTLMGDFKQIPPVRARGMFREIAHTLSDAGPKKKKKDDDPKETKFIALTRKFRQDPASKKLAFAIDVLERNLMRQQRTSFSELVKPVTDEKDEEEEKEEKKEEDIVVVVVEPKDESLVIYDTGAAEEVTDEEIEHFARCIPLPQFLVLTHKLRVRGNRIVQSIVNPDHRRGLMVFGYKYEQFRYGDIVVCKDNVNVRNEVTSIKECVFTNGSFGVIMKDDRDEFDENGNLTRPATYKTFIRYDVFDASTKTYIKRDDYYECNRFSFGTDFDLAYFVTVDRAQGKGHDHVCFIFDAERPGAMGVYTAVSRAKRSCVIAGNAEVFASITSEFQPLDEALMFAFSIAKMNRKRCREETEKEKEKKRLIEDVST